MTKTFFISVFLFVLILAMSVFAVPVTYVGTTVSDDLGTKELSLVSNIGTTSIEFNQSENETEFVINHLENEGKRIQLFVDDELYKEFIQKSPAELFNLGNIYLNEKDSDKDGISDEEDTCPFDNTNSCTLDDSDGDGVNNSEDKLFGTLEMIETNIPMLSMTVNGSGNLSQQFNKTSKVNISKDNKTLVKFSFKFGTNVLNLSGVTIKKEASGSTHGSLYVTGINLESQDTTKTVYMDRLSGEDYVCVKDQEILSVSELPSISCNQAGEIPVPCSSSGSSNNGYTCTIVGNQFMISGLKHSGVSESSYAPVVEPTGGGGGDDDSVVGPTSGSGGDSDTTTTVPVTTTTLPSSQEENTVPEDQSENQGDGIIEEPSPVLVGSNNEDTSTQSQTENDGLTGFAIAELGEGSLVFTIIFLLMIVVLSGIFVFNKYVKDTLWYSEFKYKSKRRRKL